MRIFLRTALLCTALVTLLLSLRMTAPASPSGDADAIRALVESYRHAFEARNIDGIMAVYAPSDLFVFDAVPPRDYPSAAAYRQDWLEILKLFPGRVRDRVEQFSVTVQGSIAYGHHVEDVRLTRKDGSVWHVVLRITDVYRREGQRWQIVQEHVSWPVDPATGKADFLSRE